MNNAIIVNTKEVNSNGLIIPDYNSMKGEGVDNEITGDSLIARSRSRESIGLKFF